MKRTKSEENIDKETQLSKEAEPENRHVKVNAAKKEKETLPDDKVAECSELDAVKNAFEELQNKYNQLNDTYLRSLAEFDNYRKRTLREKADLIRTGGESVLINILTVVDDMERGIKLSSESKDITAVKEGMDLIHSKFLSFLMQNGIRVIETEGVAFDTDHHEAVATTPAPDESLKGKIIDCVQKGYYLHDKVIRFAKVIVGE
jgi:molecular chaperone GrpE